VPPRRPDGLPAVGPREHPDEDEEDSMRHVHASRTLWILASCIALLAAPALAATSATAGGHAVVRSSPPVQAPLGSGTNWIDHWDTYGLGTQMQDVGGWFGWSHVLSAAGFTTDVQSRTTDLSLDDQGSVDQVHQYTGYTSGTWVYTAWMFIPSSVVGNPYFILLNQYDDSGATNNWSTQVCFDTTTGTVVDDVPGTCTGPGPMSIIYDQWVEVRVVINLDTNTQTFYYGGQMLYSDSWTEHVSGGGILAVGAVDLFANGSTSVYWDDPSLTNLPFDDDFETGDTYNWSFYQP
jgi:hypothetical protein